MKTIAVEFKDEAEYTAAKTAKGTRTWRDVIVRALLPTTTEERK